jgi:hypothetical protein
VRVRRCQVQKPTGAVSKPSSGILFIGRNELQSQRDLTAKGRKAASIQRCIHKSLIL